jgi:RimJ/RimL family protein N-acetyltransferase
MKYFRKIESERLYLSPINIDDYEIYAKWANDKKVMLNLGAYGNILNAQAEKEFLEKLSREMYNFSIVLNNDELIGSISLMDLNYVNQTATLGLFIGEEEKRGQGYGTEAIKAMLDFGFSVLNLNNIMLTVFEFNECGIKAYKKAGFKEFGRRHNDFYYNNRYYDTIFMEILRSDFYGNNDNGKVS